MRNGKGVFINARGDRYYGDWIVSISLFYAKQVQSGVVDDAAISTPLYPFYRSYASYFLHA